MNKHNEGEHKQILAILRW